MTYPKNSDEIKKLDDAIGGVWLLSETIGNGRTEGIIVVKGGMRFSQAIYSLHQYGTKFPTKKYFIKRT